MTLGSRFASACPTAATRSARYGDDASLVRALCVEVVACSRALRRVLEDGTQCDPSAQQRGTGGVTSDGIASHGATSAVSRAGLGSAGRAPAGRDRLVAPNVLHRDAPEARRADGGPIVARGPARAKPRLDSRGRGVHHVRGATAHKGVDELFTEMTAEDPKSPRSVVYKRKQNGWFVLSGYDGANIFYDKVVKLGERNLSFSLVYPAKQKADYEADTAYIANSFRTIGTPAPRPPTGLCRNSGDCTPGYHCTPGGFCIINY